MIMSFFSVSLEIFVLYMLSATEATELIRVFSLQAAVLSKVDFLWLSKVLFSNKTKEFTFFPKKIIDFCPSHKIFFPLNSMNS